MERFDESDAMHSCITSSVCKMDCWAILHIARSRKAQSASHYDDGAE